MFRRILSHHRALSACAHNATTRSLVTRRTPNVPPPPTFPITGSRPVSSKTSQSNETGETTNKAKKDVANVEDPFSAPTYNIPEKPVTFVEGASYSVVILAGLGIAAAAGYAVFKELIFQPKEYKIYNKALKRIQDDGQIRVRIGFPITGYGQESRNRAARQRIPHRVWTDEEGVEHVEVTQLIVGYNRDSERRWGDLIKFETFGLLESEGEVNFYIRGPHGHGKVFAEMFKGADNEWKFTYLIVEIRAPSTAQIILESYIPSYSATK
ncbi:putative mitochondrial import inner membrane translocase subunit TIM21 [Glycine soja]